MEYFIGAISVISLILNFLVYRRITATYVLGSVEELELATAHFCQCEAKEPLEPEVIHEHRYPQENGQGFPINQCLDCGYWDNPPKVKTQESYSAWMNQKEIPWVPPVKTPEPIIKPPNRPPLARPDGFV